MKKIWQIHRENIVSICAIVSTMVAISGLFLKLAELQQKPRTKEPTLSEIQIKENPQLEVSVSAEAQLK